MANWLSRQPVWSFQIVSIVNYQLAVLIVRDGTYLYHRSTLLYGVTARLFRYQHTLSGWETQNIQIISRCCLYSFAPTFIWPRLGVWHRTYIYRPYRSQVRWGTCLMDYLWTFNSVVSCLVTVCQDNTYCRLIVVSPCRFRGADWRRFGQLGGIGSSFVSIVTCLRLASVGIVRRQVCLSVYLCLENLF